MGLGVGVRISPLFENMGVIGKFVKICIEIVRGGWMGRN